MERGRPRYTRDRSAAAADVYNRQSQPQWDIGPVGHSPESVTFGPGPGKGHLELVRSRRQGEHPVISPVCRASAGRPRASSIRDGLQSRCRAIGLPILGAPETVLEGARDRDDPCLLYTSDAADERSSGDLGGRRTLHKNTTSR